MKSALLGLCICFVLLQGCSQQKSGETSGTGTATNTPSATAPTAAGPTPEELAKMTKSQRYFVESKAALEKHDTKGCFDLLGKAVDAAKEEKNYAAAIMCAETQAKLKVSEKDHKAATVVLENTLRDFDKPDLDMNARMRLEGPKALLASLYAIDGQADKSDALYKKSLEAAKAEKPINHQRVAFWMRNYADFYKFKKDSKNADLMQKNADQELAKDPQTAGMAAAHAAAGIAPGGAPGGAAPAKGGK